jgi:hypothetical protein
MTPDRFYIDLTRFGPSTYVLDGRYMSEARAEEYLRLEVGFSYEDARRYMGLLRDDYRRRRWL